MKKILTATALCGLMAGAAHAEKIGVAMSLFDDNFLTVLRHNIQRHADELGVEVQMEDAQGDIARQQSQIENFAASGVDGIITMLVDADSGRAMSKIAEDAGIPLVFVNMLPANMDSFPEKQAWVGSDEEQAGRLETTEVCKLLGGKGQAVILLGQLGTTGQRGRTAAVERVLASNTVCVISPWRRASCAERSMPSFTCTASRAMPTLMVRTLPMISRILAAKRL